MRKIQLPVIGGIRKTIEIPNSGTTIAEFGEGTVTLAQLKAALGIVTSSGSNTSSSAAGSSAASLVPGPGLSGGGILIGSVAINLVAPIPALLWGDDDTDDHMPFVAPPPQGRPASKGANWVSGTALVAGSTNVVYVQCPNAGHINSVEMLSQGGTGSCVVDIWSVPVASFPPSSANSICGGNLPAIVGGITHLDSALTGWIRDINAGDVLAFNLNSVSVFTQVQIVLRILQQS